MAERWSRMRQVRGLLKHGAFWRPFEKQRLVKQIFTVLEPVWPSCGVNLPLTPDCLFIRIKTVLVQNPQADTDCPQELSNYSKEEMELEIRLCHHAAVTKLTQAVPTLENALAQKGFGTIRVISVFDTSPAAPSHFLSQIAYPKTEVFAEDVQAVRTAAERLGESSPLKESMNRLAQSLEKKVSATHRPERSKARAPGSVQSPKTASLKAASSKSIDEALRNLQAALSAQSAESLPLHIKNDKGLMQALEVISENTKKQK